MAFRGCYDDCIDDENVRNIIKCGAGVERLSLYLRLGWRLESVGSEIGKLIKRMERTNLKADPSAERMLVTHLPGVPIDEHASLLAAVESLFAL